MVFAPHVVWETRPTPFCVLLCIVGTEQIPLMWCHLRGAIIPYNAGFWVLVQQLCQAEYRGFVPGVVGIHRPAPRRCGAVAAVQSSGA